MKLKRENPGEEGMRTIRTRNKYIFNPAEDSIDSKTKLKGRVFTLEQTVADLQNKFTAFILKYEKASKFNKKSLKRDQRIKKNMKSAQHEQTKKAEERRRSRKIIYEVVFQLIQIIKY